MTGINQEQNLTEYIYQVKTGTKLTICLTICWKYNDGVTKNVSVSL